MFAAQGIIYSNYDNGNDAGTLRLRSSSTSKIWMFTRRASASYNLELWNYNG